MRIFITGASSGFGAMAAEIVHIVNLPKGQRPFRSHIDPSQDGADVVNAVADRVRVHTDLLHVKL